MADGRECVQFFRQTLLFQSMAQPLPSSLPEPRQSASTTLLKGLSVLTNTAPPCCKRGVAEATTRGGGRAQAHPCGVVHEAAVTDHNLRVLPQVHRPAVLHHKQVLARTVASGRGSKRAPWRKEERTRLAALASKAQPLIATRPVLPCASAAPPSPCAQPLIRHAHEGVGDTPRERHVWCARKTRGCAGTRSRRSSTARCGLPPTQRHQSLRR